MEAWKSLKGMRRVQAEFKHLSADVAAKKWGFLKDLSVVNDNLLVWRLKLSDFDNDLPGGQQLNEDLRRLKQQYGQDHLLMEIEFPQDYPHQPFFVRVVSPRCKMYTGHVTAGGSICLEALTNSGTAGSWQSDYSVESLINVIVINMIDCPVTYIQTATGPGGRTGPLRVDFNQHNPTMGYSSHEARAAFHRTLKNHQQMGWGHGGDGQAGGAAAAAAGGAGPAAAARAGAAAPRCGLVASAALAAGPLAGGFGANNAGPSAAAAAAAAAAGASGGLVHRRQRFGLPVVSRAGAAIAAAKAAASSVAAAPSYGPAAAAAATSPPARTPRKKPAAAAAFAAVINLCSDDDDSDNATVAASKPPAPRRRQRQQQDQQQQPAAAGPAGPAAALGSRKRPHVIDDCDSDDSVVGRLGGPKRKSPTTGKDEGASSKPAAQGNTNAGSGTHQQAPAARRVIPDPVVPGAPYRPRHASRHPTAAQQQGASPSAVVTRGQQAAAAAAAAAGMASGNIQLAGASAQHAALAAARAQRAALVSLRAAKRQPQQQRHLAHQALLPPELLPLHLEVNAAVQEQVVMAGGDNGGARVQLQLDLPPHWDYSQPTDRNTVRLVDLPLPDAAGNPPAQQDPLEAAAAAAGIDEDHVVQLTRQGLHRAGALAALLLAQGSVEEALVIAVTCQDCGGAAKVLSDMQAVKDPFDVLQESCEAEARAASTQQKLVEEVEGVLHRLEASSGGVFSRSTVLKVERVQHARLWRRYALKRSELVDTRGRDGLNERLLFHGTSPGTADRIIQEGFDMRLHAVASYGNGIYFADHSSTAYGYCRKPDAVQTGQPVYKIIIARVLLGNQTQGVAGMRRPPDGYDSVNSGKHGRGNLHPHNHGTGMYCHVVFDNDQCYPEYLVTLKR